MAKLDKTLGPTCQYLCTGGRWVLNGGGAPPGFYCERFQGVCFTEGVVVLMDPTPLPPGGPADRPVGSNAAAYHYDLGTDSLYFSEGQAEPGYMFISKISLAELWDRFPSIAREVELIKQAKSISSFSIEIPSVAIAHETE